MARIQKALPVKLFLGLEIKSPEILGEVLEALVAKYGDLDLRSPSFEIPPASEKSSGAFPRKLLSFDTLTDPGRLARIKRSTDRVERELSPRRRRAAEPPVRIAPGYIDSAKVVLASQKNAPHRVYLGRGVYGEVTLVFQDGVFRPHPWTLPEYQAEASIHFFAGAHERYLDQIQLAH